MSGIKTVAFDTGRTIAVAAITAIVIIAGLTVAYGPQQRQQQQVSDTLVRTNLAQACVLALPQGPEGRDPLAVQYCFTQYHLEAPLLQSP